MKKSKKGMYVKYIRSATHDTVPKIAKIKEEEKHLITLDNGCVIPKTDVIDAENEIIDLVEYMDLIEIENSVKLYEQNEVIYLFNPVKCDGFITFQDGTRCIVLNMNYYVDVKDLKIKSVLTREQFDNEKYVVNEVE